MNSTLRRLNSVHRQLHSTVEAVDLSLFTKRPAENEWSISEIVHHLCLVDERVLAELSKNINTSTPKVSIFKRMIPMQITEDITDFRLPISDCRLPIAIRSDRSK